MQRSLTEIARLCQKSERTIRRWIDDGVLTVSRLNNGMYEIAEEEIAKKRGPGDMESLILQRLAEIDERLQRIETMLLAQPIKQIAPRRSPAPVRQPELIPSMEVTQERASAEGAISLHDLARELGLNKSTLYGHIKSKRAYQPIELPDTRKPGETTTGFSAEEADRIRSDYGQR